MKWHESGPAYDKRSTAAAKRAMCLPFRDINRALPGSIYKQHQRTRGARDQKVGARPEPLGLCFGLMQQRVQRTRRDAERLRDARLVAPAFCISRSICRSIVRRGRPSRFPFDRACLRPARTRSWINPRSNSAIAPMI
jgi:hypothetical protein